MRKIAIVYDESENWFNIDWDEGEGFQNVLVLSPHRLRQLAQVMLAMSLVRIKGDITVFEEYQSDLDIAQEERDNERQRPDRS